MQKKRSSLTKTRIINAIIATLTIFALTSGDFFIMGQEVMAATAGINLDSRNRRYLK